MVDELGCLPVEHTTSEDSLSTYKVMPVDHAYSKLMLIQDQLEQATALLERKQVSHKCKCGSYLLPCAGGVRKVSVSDGAVVYHKSDGCWLITQQD